MECPPPLPPTHPHPLPHHPNHPTTTPPAPHPPHPPMLYGETGTTDVKTKIMCRMTNFWAKLRPIRTDKFPSMLFHLMSNLQYQQLDVFDFKWIKCVQNWLNHNGFSEMWEMLHINTNWFKHIFKLRCNDIFQQNWQEEVMSNSQCSNYRVLKKCHELENHITDLEPMHVVNLGKFRTRTHHLPVTNQRFHDASANINCTLCQNGEVGDECHYLFKCDYFAEEQNSLMPPYCKTDPAEECFKAIFRVEEKESLTKVARFAKIIMSKLKFKCVKERHRFPLFFVFICIIICVPSPIPLPCR